MSEYTNLATLAMRQPQRAIGTFLGARAFSAAFPGRLRLSGGGALMTSPTGDLSADMQGLAEIPYIGGGTGLEFRTPYSWAEEGFIDGNVKSENQVRILSSDFALENLRDVIGAKNYNFAKALKDWYLSRLKGRGILSPDQDWQVYNAVMHGVLFRLTPIGKPQWDAVAAEMAPFWNEYSRKAIDAAAQAVADSERAAERWEAIYSVVDTVASLPTTVVGTVGKLSGIALWEFFKRNPVLILAVAGAAVWFFLPKIKATKAAVMAARG